MVGRTVYGLVLVGSLAMNAYLLAARSRAAETSVPKKRPAATRHAGPLGTNQDLPKVAVPADIASLDRTAREKRLAVAESKLDALLPLHEKFELGEPDIDSEARVRALLDRVFEGSEIEFEVECRGLICRITSKDASHDWQTAIQQDFDAIGFFSQQAFGGGAMFARVEEPGRSAGINWSFRVLMALATSASVKACKQDKGSPGVVELAMRLDRSSHKVAVIATGSLAQQPIGVCLRRAMEAVIAKMPLPAAATAIHEEPFPIPVGAP